MKKLSLFFFATLLYANSFAQTGASISSVTVTTPFECWVALINNEEAEYAEYGWWTVWDDLHSQYKFAITTEANNYTVTLPGGTGSHTLVVYWPFSMVGNTNSDGIVMEDIYIEANEYGDDPYNDYYTFEASDFVDWNCLSCPWLYVHNGTSYERMTEVIKDVTGKDKQQTTQTGISHAQIIDGKLKIKLQEEKDETTFLDRVSLLVNGVAVSPVSGVDNALLSEDEVYLILDKDQFIEMEFVLPADLASDAEIVLETNGYYEPSMEYIQDVYQRCLVRSSQNK